MMNRLGFISSKFQSRREVAGIGRTTFSRLSVIDHTIWSVGCNVQSPIETTTTAAANNRHLTTLLSKDSFSSSISSPLTLSSYTISKPQLFIPTKAVGCRKFASLSETDIRKRLDEFQDLFVEARLCIEDVVESAGTKYFDDDAEAAQEAVDEAVTAFEKLIDDIDDVDEKNRILRGNGLKVEQLKGELELALKGGHDH